MRRACQFAFPFLKLALFILYFELDHAMRVHEVEIGHRSLEHYLCRCIERGISMMCGGRSGQHEKDEQRVLHWAGPSSTQRSRSRTYRRPLSVYMGTVTTR